MNRTPTLTLPALLASAVFLLPQPGAAQGANGREIALREQVRALAVPGDIESRRAAIVRRLEQIGLSPQLAWFDPPPGRADRRGANVVADIRGTAANVLLLGAHYDHVGVGEGVIDNAAGVAAVLHLAESLARNPLTNFTVRVALFDLEEDGLLGSRAMVADSLRTPLPRKFLNFDVFGYGDAFWIGALDAGAPLPSSFSTVAAQSGWQAVIDPVYPPSDHLSFRGTSTASYAISMLGAEEIHDMLARIQARDMSLGGPPPRIFRILHTPEDTFDKLDAAAVARALAVVERAIRQMDARSR